MIITPKSGRLCNRLCLAANFICHAAKYGGSYLQLGFSEYSSLFPSTSHSGKLFFNSSKPRAKRIRFPIGYLDITSSIDAKGIQIDMGSKYFLDTEDKFSILFARGWKFRDHNATIEYGHVARAFFTPQPFTISTVSTLIDKINPHKERILVGVHIRQTDYATFRNGEFFFPLKTYRRCMEAISAFSPREVTFIVASDAPFDGDELKGLDWHPAPNDIIAYNYTSSQCDYILGTKSSYNGWASYFGETPVFQMTKEQPPKSFSDFAVYQIATRLPTFGNK